MDGLFVTMKEICGMFDCCPMMLLLTKAMFIDYKHNCNGRTNHMQPHIHSTSLKLAAKHTNTHTLSLPTKDHVKIELEHI